MSSLGGVYPVAASRCGGSQSLASSSRASGRLSPTTPRAVIGGGARLSTAPVPRTTGVCRVSTTTVTTTEVPEPDVNSTEDPEDPEEGVDAPRLPWALPVVGNALSVAQLTGTGFTKDGLVELYAKAVEEYGPVVQCKLGPETAFFINDPELATEMCIRRVDKYGTRFVPEGMYMPFTLPEAGYTEEEKAKGGCPLRGLVFVNGDIHKKYRSIGMASLAKKEVKTRIEGIVSDKAQMWLERWQKAGDTVAKGVRVDLETQRFTVDVIGQAAFSYDFEQLTTEFSPTQVQARFVQEINNSLIAASEAILKDPLGLWRFFETSPKARNRKHLGWLKEFEDDLIRQRTESIASGNPAGDDFLGTLLSTRDEDGMPLPALDVRWAVHDMFIAGNDTTASSLAAAMAMLALNPEKQAKLRQELTRLEGRVPAASDVEPLQYLDAVCRETLRLYPAASVFGRRLSPDVDDVLGGYRVPGNSILFMSPQVMGRSPELWTDPECFQPERFLSGGEWGTTTPRGAWIPFGLGNRSCIGGQLALLEMKVVLATLVQHFEFCPAPGDSNGVNSDGQSLQVAYDITMAFPDGLNLLAKPL